MEQEPETQPSTLSRCLTLGVELEFFVPRRFPGVPGPARDSRHCEEIRDDHGDCPESFGQNLRKLRAQLIEAYEGDASREDKDRLYESPLLESLDLATKAQMRRIANALTDGSSLEEHCPDRGTKPATQPREATVQTRCVAKSHLQGPELGPLDARGIHQGYEEWVLSQEESFMWYEKGRGARNKHYPKHCSSTFDWLGLELASRVFRDVDAARVEVGWACRLLRNQFLVSVNAGAQPRAAGLHVHWGLQEFGGLEVVLVVKRLLTFMWAAEEKLMDLHASWRQAPEMAKYAAMLKFNSNLALAARGSPVAEFDAEKPRLPTNKTQLTPSVSIITPDMVHNLPEMYQDCDEVRRIWAAKTVEELAFLARTPKGAKGALSLQELVQPNDPSKGPSTRKTMLKTVEFRHMQGSLEPEHIHAWMAVTGRIMTLCASENGPSDFCAILDRVGGGFAGEAYTVFHLLRDIGVCNRVIDYLKYVKPQAVLDAEADPLQSGVFLKAESP